jgi:pimeloyl-ACP methyl ester carboxylesterase
MGGWLSLLVARQRPERLAGLVLIAAAPDFTERMLLQKLSAEDRILLQRDGRLERPSQYSPEPSVFTWKLIEEGRNHLVLDKTLALPCAVHLLHGQRDPDVPWEYSLHIAERLEAPEVITTFVKGGDHRLSTPADIARLVATVEELVR